MRGLEQFCRSGQMIGKHRDGGYAEFIKVPGANAFPLPDEIPFEVGAIMMCSSATALHALNKARFKAGESIAIFGLADSDFRHCNWHALSIAKMSMWLKSILRSSRQPLSMGAIAIDARSADPVEQIKEATAGRGVDVALELIGVCKNHAPGRALPGPSRTRRPCRINRRIDVDSSVH